MSAPRWTEDELKALLARQAARKLPRRRLVDPEGNIPGLPKQGAQTVREPLPAFQKPAKRAKYGNTKSADGFASLKESRRYAELAAMERAGQIRNLRTQVKFVLVPKQDGERSVCYVCDVAYEEPGLEGQSPWREVIEDTKSPSTRKKREYVIKRKLMLHVHGIKVRET